jgi:hypothetical protein
MRKSHDGERVQFGGLDLTLEKGTKLAVVGCAVCPPRGATRQPCLVKGASPAQFESERAPQVEAASERVEADNAALDDATRSSPPAPTPARRPSWPPSGTRLLRAKNSCTPSTSDWTRSCSPRAER